MATELASKYIKLRPRRPEQPTNVDPADGGVISLTPTLISSAFSTNEVEGEVHIFTRWRIATDSNMTSVIYDTGLITDLESHDVPVSAGLLGNATYYWDVQHIGAKGGASAPSNATSMDTVANIDELFNTVNYTGNGGVQTITTNIDMTGKGFIISWLNGSATLFRTPLNITTFALNHYVKMNGGTPESVATSFTGYLSTGYTLGNTLDLNSAGNQYTTMSARASKSFCDVLEWTGDGAGSRAIPHALQSDVGYIVVYKKVAGVAYAIPRWFTGMAANEVIRSSDKMKVLDANVWGNTLPTSTDIYVGTGDNIETNVLGEEYTALVFPDNSPLGVEVGQYTGTGVSGLKINTAKAPGFIWIVAESPTGSSLDNDSLHNKVGGIAWSKEVDINVSQAAYQGLVSYDADGFTLNADGRTNRSGTIYHYVVFPDPLLA